MSRDPFISKAFPHTVLKMLSARISWTDFFFEKHFFQGLGAFFTTEKPLNWAPFFYTKKLILYFFSKAIIAFAFNAKSFAIAILFFFSFYFFIFFLLLLVTFSGCTSKKLFNQRFVISYQKSV